MPDSLGPKPPGPLRGPNGRLTADFSLPAVLEGLRQHRRWVGWKWTQKPNGEWDKPPYRVDFPDFHASTTNPKTWGTLEAAERALMAGQIDGIGYVVAQDEDLVWWDLDKCRDPETGEIADWAARCVEEANSYTEITPSGRGLRIIGTHGDFLQAQIHTAYKLPQGGEGEVFFKAARYVTISGIHLPGTPIALADISGAVLDMLASAGKQRRTVMDDTPARSREEALAPLEDVAAALRTIRNDDLHYDDWVRVGLATYAASGGSGEGFEAWQRWSAKSEKHHDHECLRVWQSFHRSAPRKIGFGSLAYLARSANPLWVAPSWQGKPVADEAPAGPSISVAFDPETGEILEPKKPKLGRGLRLLSIADVEALPPPEWLIDGLIPENALVMPYGPPGAGKTFIVLSQALHIAAGKEWAGKAVKQGAVVYVVGEGLGGFSIRLKAMRHLYGLSADLPLYMVPRAVNFREEKEVAELVALIRAAVPPGTRIAFVVIDTLARAMPGVDENSAQEVGLIIAKCDQVREELACTVAPIHHTGKDVERGLRGSNALLGAVDATYLIQAAGKGHVKLVNEKQKDGEPHKAMTFLMEPVIVGLRSSLVPVLVERGTVGRPAADDRPDPDEMRMRVLLAMEEAKLDMMKFADVASLLGCPSGRAKTELGEMIPLGRQNAAQVGAYRLWKSAQGTAANAPQFVHREVFHDRG